MHYLLARMHTAIGAAGGSHAERLARDRGKRSLERILHAAAARLGLPAQKAAAVVLER
jgi:hypothetical protein